MIQHGDSRDRFVFFFPKRICGVQILADLFVYALVIDHQCVPRGQQLSAVFGGEGAFGRGGGTCNTPQMYGSNLKLGRCSLSFNLHVINTISDASCFQYVSHSWLSCKSLMFLIFLTLVVTTIWRTVHSNCGRNLGYFVFLIVSNHV